MHAKSSASGRSAKTSDTSGGKTTPSKSKGIQIKGDGKYPLVPLSAVTIVERPKKGEKKLFYNPRSAERFSEDALASLRMSIRVDGLQKPPIVRTVEEDGIISKVELVAGERRTRCCMKIVADDLPCYDEDEPIPSTFKAGSTVLYRGHFCEVVSQKKDAVTLIKDGEQQVVPYEDVRPTVSGAKLYGHVPCKVARNCSDRQALRLAFIENDEAEPLPISDQIALVERLLAEGEKQEDIADIIGSNPTWVSQTANFRKELPPKAFQKLVSGMMSRHVAVTLLSYDPDVRNRLFDEAVVEEERISQARIRDFETQVVEAEDSEDLYEDEASEAEAEGRDEKARKARKRAAAAKRKGQDARARRRRAEDEAGVVTQGHVQKAALKLGVAPIRGKILSRAEINSHIEKLTEMISTGTVDPDTGKKPPVEYLSLVKRTLVAVLEGEKDPTAIYRDFMIANGYWEESCDLTSKLDPALAKESRGSLD